MSTVISAASPENQSDAWYACEASLGKERCVRLNEWKIRRSAYVKYASLIVSCHWISAASPENQSIA